MFERALHFQLVVIVVWLFVLILLSNFSIKGEQQFSYLAQSFLHGKTYFLTMPGTWNDAVLYSGKYFWAEGPFPAILLLLPTLLLNFFYQGYLNIILVALVFGLVYKISKKIGFTKFDGILLSLAFCFSSPFFALALIPWAWYFSQVAIVLLVLLTINEWLNLKRFWIIGLFLAGALATRLSIFPMAILFFYLAMREHKLREFIIPILISVAFLCFYNFARFGNFFESGYSYTLLPPDTTLTRQSGLFNAAHLPRNFYYALLNFIPSPMGTSLILTSPYLLYLFFMKKLDFISKLFLITSGVIFLLVLSYHGTGFRQFGYRFAMDFFPLLFFVLVKNIYQQKKKIPSLFKILIISSVFLNFYLLSTIFV